MKKLPTYDPVKIEKKWQKKWASSKIYRSTETEGKRKFYALDMFPYPSGEGLHVGHPKGYIATDVVSRMRRMQGMNVLHPMGFDAFGLPAENYAIKMKTNPMVGVAKNVKHFKEQLEILGLDYDWSREVNTTDPKYYRWTQWIFLQLLKEGLAYESDEPVNWCPTDKTVLANEDIENGRCERCGTLVEKKKLRQWVLRITDYADRLLRDLDTKKLPSDDLVETMSNGEICFVQMTEPGAVRPDRPFVEREAIMAIVEHWSEDKFIALKWKKVSWNTTITGGVEKGQTPEQAARAEVTEETGYKNLRLVKKLDGQNHSKFFHVPKDENRFGHFTNFHFKLENDERNAVEQNEQAKHEVAWVPRDQMKGLLTAEAQKYVWSQLIESKAADISAKPLIDWPEAIKESQRNWIGRSEGALIKFKIKGTQKDIEVFTTRPDTLFGVTYVVLAPEAKLVNELLPSVSNKAEVDAYISNTQRETEIQRTDASKEKTGVELKGVKAINPANNEEVPVWIADYVLADYGTGSVMAVPAHDERDRVFVKKFELPIKQVIMPEFGIKRSNEEFRDGACSVVFDPAAQKYAVTEDDTGFYRLCSGGIDAGEDYKACAIRETTEESGLFDFRSVELISELITHYHNVLKKVNRVAHSNGYVIVLNSTKTKDAKLEAHESKFKLKWVSPEEAIRQWDQLEARPADHYAWLMKQAVGMLIEKGIDKKSDPEKFRLTAMIESGILTNSGKFDGKDSQAVMKEITESTGGKWVTKFKLRDWVFSRQRYWGEPIPVIHCPKCGVVPVPEKDLPVLLPKVGSYEPTGTGESPLAAIAKWVNVKCPRCGGKGKRETNTMPQWAGSSWYYLRYEDPKNSKALVDPGKEKYWSPVDLYVGGAEHATRHLIYARFWHKFLYDIGVVSGIEPFAKLQSVGLIMGEDGRKMSKRFGNVVNPDEIVKTFGADTLRVYEMFMGPFDQAIPWSTDSIVGSRRFIERIWKLGEKVLSSEKHFRKLKREGKGNDAVPASRIIHKTTKKVTEDIENLRFNTAISTLMIALNELDKNATVSRTDFESYLKLLAPFAPHAADELWSVLGNKNSIHISAWPTYDPAMIAETEAKIILQVNGKVRGSFMVPAGTGKDELESRAKAEPEAKKWLEGKQIQRVVAVVDRLVNIVVA